MNKVQLIEMGQKTLADQDTQIDNLMNTVSNIGNLGRTIGNELETDIVLLGKLNKELIKMSGK